MPPINYVNYTIVENNFIYYYICLVDASSAFESSEDEEEYELEFSSSSK